MTLTLDIQRNSGNDTQVKCQLDGWEIKEFYSFGEDYTDVQIAEHVNTDLSAKGFDLT